MNPVREGHTARSPSIRYWQAGTSGPRVLMVMGFGMRGGLWRPQIEGLSHDHQIAWLDNRGIGESERGKKALWTMADMADDVLGVAEALGWDDFHLVGVSMGGMVSQEIALRAANRLQSLSLIATHEGGRNPFRWAPRRAGMEAFIRAQLYRGDERVQALRTLLYPPSFLADCDQQALAARMRAQLAQPAPRPTLRGQLSAVMRHDTGKRLHRISTSTLIVKPEQDVLIPPKASDRLRHRLPHSSFLSLSDAGHGAIFQKAAVINEALREHFMQSEVTALAQGQLAVHA